MVVCHPAFVLLSVLVFASFLDDGLTDDIALYRFVPS
jgi:hypothetical protein